MATGQARANDTTGVEPAAVIVMRVSGSAPKRSYRECLRAAADGHLFFVYLEGSKELLTRRVGERKCHFTPTPLLESQLATLEVPTGEPGVVTVDIAAEAAKDLGRPWRYGLKRSGE